MDKPYRRLVFSSAMSATCWAVTSPRTSAIFSHTKEIISEVAGCPARVICTLEEYLHKERTRMESAPCYGEEYTLRQNVSMEKRMEQKAALDGKIGYID